MDVQLRAELQRACEALPLFPLPGVVFLPATLLPLHVFEPRYRKLVKDCLEADSIFAVPQLREGWQSDYDGRPAIHDVVGVGRVVRSQALSDGRYNLLVLGVARARVLDELPSDEPYRLARARLLSDAFGAGQEERLRVAADQLRLVAGQIMTLHPSLSQDLGRVLNGAEDNVQLTYMLGHLALRESDERQSFLETEDPVARAERVMEGLISLLGLEQGIEA